MKRTVYDLYRDCSWAAASRLTHDAGLRFGAEPYEGPWEISEVVEFLDQPTVEFWTDNTRETNPPSALIFEMGIKMDVSVCHTR